VLFQLLLFARCCFVLFVESGDLLKAFLNYVRVCMAQCPIVVLSSGRLGVVLGVVTACSRHAEREVVRSACQLITSLRALAGPTGGPFAPATAAAFVEAGATAFHDTPFTSTQRW
jgi:hypothetical protein